ncbi:MAG: hypothetical protein O3C21_00090, partial [Verrucomicrobia bacterium]|nr:hypothetical protein [Verrucomicrobiota bacterium]
MLPQSLINLVYLAVFAVIFAVPLSAQEPDLPTFDSPDVTIEWQFGLAGRIYGSDREDLRRDFANHVSFLITNHRDTIMEGVIDVGILSEHTPITNLTHESVAIGPGSTKRFSFSLSDSPFWGSWNSPSFTAQPGAGVKASFKEAQSNRLLWQRSELYVVEEMRYASQLRCLVIGNPRRVPVHSPPLLPRLPQGSQQGNALALGERSLEFQQISPWQAPDSFPCLAPFNAVVLSPDIEPDAFTAAQQRALAEYVVNSGVLVLPTETADGWREAIFSNNKRLPFSLKETADGDLFLYGNGKVSTLRMPAVGTQDAVSARQLYDLIDRHLEPPLAMKLDRQFRSSQLGTHATESAMIVAGFLGLYGVISVGALYFFRRMRRLALIRAVIVMIALFSTG